MLSLAAITSVITSVPSIMLGMLEVESKEDP